MSDTTDILNIVSELNNEENPQRRLKLILSLVFTSIFFLVLKFLFLSDILPYPSYLKEIEKSGIVDQVFVNFFVVISSFLCAFFLVWVLFYVFKYFYKVFLHLQDYSWNKELGLEDWEFQGNIVVEDKGKVIHIIQSDLGLILKNKEWKDCEMTFKFKIPKKPVLSPEDEQENQLRRGFGVIYRAKNLGEYYMLKIDINGYHPHVRHVLWENNGPILKTTLTIENLDEWINAKFLLINNHLQVEIGQDEFSFLIPTHSNISKDRKTNTAIENIENLPYAKIPFRNQGSVGFRSAFFEEVYIKDLKIKHILCF